MLQVVVVEYLEKNWDCLVVDSRAAAEEKEGEGGAYGISNGRDDPHIWFVFLLLLLLLSVWKRERPSSIKRSVSFLFSLPLFSPQQPHSPLTTSQPTKRREEIRKKRQPGTISLSIRYDDDRVLHEPYGVIQGLTYANMHTRVCCFISIKNMKGPSS